MDSDTFWTLSARGIIENLLKLLLTVLTIQMPVFSKDLPLYCISTDFFHAENNTVYHSSVVGNDKVWSFFMATTKIMS